VEPVRVVVVPVEVPCLLTSTTTLPPHAASASSIAADAILAFITPRSLSAPRVHLQMRIAA
jgi:hypothetical protein